MTWSSELTAPGRPRGPALPPPAGGPAAPAAGPASPSAEPLVPPPDVPADRRSLVAIVVVGVAVAVALRTRLDGLAGLLLVVVAAVALVASRRLRNRQAVGALVLALPFAGFLVLRTSPWLVPLDLAALAFLFGIAAAFARGGSIVDSRLVHLCQRAALGIYAAVTAPGFLGASATARAGGAHPERRARRLAVLRGVGLAVPIVVLLAVLLGSSDVVFASLFHLPIDADTVWVDGALLVVGLWIGAALVSWSSQREPVANPPLGRPLGPIEAAIVLGGLIALFATFAITQVVTAAGGADHVLRTAGLTRAEYARAGFFQLLAVAALTLLVLGLLKALAQQPEHGRGRVVLVVLAEVTVGLALVIVAVALVRLGLYDDAFGLTMLRLYSTAFAWWLGAVFVLVGVALAGVGRARHWLLAAVAMSGLAAVLVLNVIDPEATVVRHNAGRTVAADRAFDVEYVDQLSDDAVPAFVEALPTLDPEARAAAIDRICYETLVRGHTSTRIPITPEPRGVLGWNRAARAATDARATLCR